MFLFVPNNRNCLHRFTALVTAPTAENQSQGGRHAHSGLALIRSQWTDATPSSNVERPAEFTASSCPTHGHVLLDRRRDPLRSWHVAVPPTHAVAEPSQPAPGLFGCAM